MRKALPTFLSVLIGLSLAAEAQAGTYPVRQCDAAASALNPAAPDASPISNAPAYAPRDRCESSEHALHVENLEPAAAGRFGGWRYTAPEGTELMEIDIEARMERVADHVPELLVARGQGQESFARGDSNGWEQFDWSASPGAGAQTFTARLRCEPSGQTLCPESSQTRTRVRDVRFVVNDVAAPGLEIDGTLLGSGWRNGTESLAVAAADFGAGVRRIEVEVNGATAAERGFSCGTVPGRDVAVRLAPCAGTEVAAFDLETGAAPFREGQNAVEVCVEDYGTDRANRTCESELVRVDNEGPGPPIDLHVVGGDDWRATNSFDIAWTNPEQPEGGSAIDGAWYRIENEAGETVVGPVLRVPGVQR